MKDINLLSLDMELNQPSRTIIQIGCIIGNLKSGEILKEYLAFIKTDEIINPRITKLTGIKQSEINMGISLQQTYKDLKLFHETYGCFRNFLQWGQGDSEYLRKQLQLDDEIFLGGRRTIDAKTIYVSYRFAHNLSHQAGLAKALVKLGLQFDGRKHNALDDARNTFIIYRELLKKYKNES